MVDNEGKITAIDSTDMTYRPTNMSCGSGMVNWSGISIIRLVDIDVELFNKRPN